jgi:RimJ/RimL family protein N-acetyltransferase
MSDCTLRPFRLAEVEELDDFGAANQDTIFSWFGFRNTKLLARRWSEDGLIGPDDGMLVIAVRETDEVAGRVTWRKEQWGPADTSWCWEIGISLKLDYRGRGLGTDAQIQICNYLFAHTRAVRVQAATLIDNAAERRALEKAGFRLEGILRSAQYRDGDWHDLALYAAIKGDPR